MWILPDSIGSRSASSTRRSNSGSSSRNSTPLWAREISPGTGIEPPPTIAASEALWWGRGTASLTPPRLCGVEVDQTLYGRALQRFLIA